MSYLQKLLLLLLLAICVAGCENKKNNTADVPNPYAQNKPEPLDPKVIAAKKAEILAVMALLEGKQWDKGFKDLERILDTPSKAQDEALKQTKYKKHSNLTAAYANYRREAGFVKNIDPAIKPKPYYGLWYDPRPKWDALKAEIIGKIENGDHSEARVLFDQVEMEWSSNKEIKQEIDALRSEIAKLPKATE